MRSFQKAQKEQRKPFKENATPHKSKPFPNWFGTEQVNNAVLRQCLEKIFFEASVRSFESALCEVLELKSKDVKERRGIQHWAKRHKKGALAKLPSGVVTGRNAGQFGERPLTSDASRLR